MGIMDNLSSVASFVDSFQDDCVVCGTSTGNLDEATGLNVCKKNCINDLGDLLTRASAVNISTLAPNGDNFEQISPIMVVGTSKSYNKAFDSATFKLKKSAMDIDANSIVGIQYQFRSAMNASNNRICEIMAFGTAIKN